MSPVWSNHVTSTQTTVHSPQPHYISTSNILFLFYRSLNYTVSKTGLSQAWNEKRINNEMTDWLGWLSPLNSILSVWLWTVYSILSVIGQLNVSYKTQTLMLSEGGREGGREREEGGGRWSSNKSPTPPCPPPHLCLVINFISLSPNFRPPSSRSQHQQQTLCRQLISDMIIRKPFTNIEYFSQLSRKIFSLGSEGESKCFVLVVMKHYKYIR